MTEKTIYIKMACDFAEWIMLEPYDSTDFITENQNKL